MNVETNEMDFAELTLQELKEKIIPNLKVTCKHPSARNPFKSYLKITNWDKTKIFFFCFLVPLRLFFLVLTQLLSVVWATVFLIGYNETDPPEPLSCYRKMGVDGMIILARISCFFCGFHNIKVTGTISPEAQIIVAAPHSCFLDTWLINCIGRFTGVTKSEFRSLPIVGNCFRLMQPVYVSRDDKNSKMSVAKEITRRVNSKDWPPVVIFPEGTCTNRMSYISFKPGAFYPGLPVQPVIIRYPDCSAGALDYATWSIIGPGIALLLPLMMSQLNNRVEIEILPLYVPSQDEIDNPVLYARNVRDFIARADNVPATDHSYEDCRLMKAARRLNLPMEAGLVEYYKLSPIIGMNCDDMIDKLKAFAKIDQNCDGVIDVEEFCRYLKLPFTEEVISIFHIYDLDKDNYIDFREYLLGLFFISRHLNSDANIRHAYSLFDTQQMGYITYNSVSNLFENSLHIDCKYAQFIFDELDLEKNGTANYDQFKMFCLNKPEYVLLFLHIQNLSKKADS